MAVRIALLHERANPIPVRIRLGAQKIVFVGERPPDVAEGTKTGDDVANETFIADGVESKLSRWIPASSTDAEAAGRNDLAGTETGRKAKDRKTLALFVGHVRPADRPRRLHVEYSYPKGRIGIDLSNGLKSIEDALVKLNVLKNDSRKWLNWVSATSVEGPLGTRIVVEDEGYGEG